jgi:hypothetical protein
MKGFAVDADRNTGFQLMDRGGRDRAFHLDPVFPVMPEAGIEQPVVQGSVIGQDEQSFTVVVQAADRIAIGRYGEEIFQGKFTRRGAELREYLEGFVYNVVLVQAVFAFVYRV